MSLMQEALLALLNDDGVTDQDAFNALEEFACTSIAQGKRVRDYCENLTEVLVRVNRSTSIQKLLNSGTLAILFPFIRITSPYFPSSPPFPPSLVPSSSLGAITRKQLIDALSRLSRQASLPKESIYTEGLVFEVVLEYIGRKWRTEQDDLVKVVGRKLTEIEFEASQNHVQMQGDLSTVRSTIHPALQKARFLLGFLSSAQLVVRLNASALPTIPASDRVRPDPEQLVRAFITRRLASGSDPTSVILDLSSTQSRLNSASHKSMLITTIASFGLQCELPPPTEFTSPTSSNYEPPSPSPTSTSFGPTISPRRATFSRLANKWASKRPMPLPTAPKWLTHRKNYSYSAKIAAPGFNPDRRPSLPTLPSAPLTHISSPLAGSMISFHTPTDTVREVSQEWDDLGDIWPKSRDDLLHRLLRLRYRVLKTGGWYLGKNQIDAQHLLNHSSLPIDDVSALRDLFQIPTPSTPSATESPERAPSLAEGSSPPSTPRMLPPPRPSLVPLSPVDETDLPAPRNLISPLSFASFDPEEYYARIASARSSHAPKLSLASITTSVEHSSDSQHTATQNSHKARRHSTGVESLLSEATFQTGLTYGRGSRMSAFSIQQARHEWQNVSTAYMLNLPPLPLQHSDGVGEICAEEEVLPPYHQHRRSRSETDLLAMISNDDPLSPAPLRPSSLRRKRGIDPNLQFQLSSYRLGQPLPNLPGTSIQSHSVPDVRFQSPSDDANHNQPGGKSLLLSGFGMGQPPPSPPISPDLPVYKTPRPSAFPMPPNNRPAEDSFATLPRLRAGFSNRQYTVIHGEVSPSSLGSRENVSGYFDAPSSPPDPSSSPAATSGHKSNPSSSSSNSRRRNKALPVPPRTSSLARRPVDQHLLRPQPLQGETPLSLALSLFDIAKLPLPPQAHPDVTEAPHVITPKRDLTVNDVNIVLGDMVDSERARVKSRDRKWDDAATCRVGWLMDQVGDLLNDSRFSPIIDVHLERLGRSLQNTQVNRPSPSSSASSHTPSPRDKPSSPLAISQTTLHADEPESPRIPQSSPRPPPRPLVRVVSPIPPQLTRPKPTRTVPLSPAGKPPTRPLPPRPTCRQTESRGSMGSRRSSKMSIGTFGH